MTCKHLLTAFAISAGILLSGCVSPLDTDAPRKETPITPAVKVTPSSYSVEFSGTSSGYRMKGLPTLTFDTTVTPTRCWLDYTMEVDPAYTPQPMLKEFRVRVDSFACDGLITNLIKGEVNFWANFGSGIQQYPSEANTNTASIIVAEHPEEPGKPRKITITMYFVMNKDGFFVGVGKEYPFGKIDVVL